MSVVEGIRQTFACANVKETIKGSDYYIEVKYHDMDFDFDFDTADSEETIVNHIVSEIKNHIFNEFADACAACLGVNTMDVEWYLSEGKTEITVNVLGLELKQEVKQLLYEVHWMGVEVAAESCVRCKVIEKPSVQDMCAKFYIVSKGQYESDNGVNYENIKLPKRATKGSAGYDFFAPFDFELAPGESRVIPTGIRCQMTGNYVLQCYPRSGHGFKYLVRLANTVGIIDSDYFGSKNEGHIMIKLVNGGEKALEVKAGDAFCQGIFTRFGITFDDDADGVRDGGFGSTSK